MKEVYIVFYDREHPTDYDDYFCECIERVFETKEKAIEYCESIGTKDEIYDWYNATQREPDCMYEEVDYKYRYYIRRYSVY